MSSEQAGLQRWSVVAVGLAAAVPSLLWALDGSGLIHDDWSIASGVEFEGVWETIVSRSTGSPARPLSAVYYGVTYGLFGQDPLPHALTLAALNGLAASLLLVVGNRLSGRRLALWITLVWVALPNRGSTRLWIAMAPAVLALCLLLIAIALLHDDLPLPAGAVLALAILAYEAVAAIALAALVVWVWRWPGGSLRRAAAPLALVLGAGTFILAFSPKRGEGETPFSHGANLVAAQFGRGVFGPLARVGALLVLVALALAAARSVLPSSRGGTSHQDRPVLAGFILVLLGAGPFFVAGFPFATDGIFDRGNLFAGVGTAVMLGALLSAMALAAGPVGLLAAAALVGYVAAFNMVDLRDYRQAVRQGESLQAQLAADLPTVSDPIVVGPPLPARGGVAQFIAYGDLGAALQIARGDQSLRVRIAISADDFATADEPIRYDWVQRGYLKTSPPGP